MLKAIANNARSWSQVRNYILEKYGLALPKSTLSRLVEKMEKLELIRNYEFLDQVYRKTASKLVVRLY